MTNTTRTNRIKGFTDDERKAMKERAQELMGKTDGTGAVLAKIAQMPEPDRLIGKRHHEIIMKSATMLTPRTWYGMPAYAKNGKVVCFFSKRK